VAVVTVAVLGWLGALDPFALVAVLFLAVGLGVSLAAGLFDAAVAVWAHVWGEEGER
jgi:hypothetical protein